MEIIKLTNLKDDSTIYINVNHIGHFTEVKEKHTSVGVITHNNGGFEVKESMEEILSLLRKAKINSRFKEIK